MVRWVIGLIHHGGTIELFLPVCGMMHIKEPLLLIGKSNPCGGSGFFSHYKSGPLPCVCK